MPLSTLSYLSKNCRKGHATTLAEYQAAGGYMMLKKAVTAKIGRAHV